MELVVARARRPKFSTVCSKPNVSSSDLQDLAELQDSFGYACNRAQNLALLQDTIIYASGRVLHVLHPETQTLSLRLCSRNARAIGHFATNPHENHVAVGEEGEEPSIFVYQWPNFEVVTEFRNGTRKSFVCLNYSADGEILCSQGAEPDFTLALWDWQRETLLLTCRPSELPVLCVAYSYDQHDTIITSGRGHIGFWRTAKTFTGLKISGECGKFGTTEVTDVNTFECLPGGKVASNCSWGNILVWSNARVEYEITTKRKNVACHLGPVSAFHALGDRLVSIGSDGWVRMWGLNTGKREEKDGRILSRQEAVLYFRIARDACLMSKVHDHTSPSDEVWYLQDGKGAIWRAAVGKALRGETSSPKVTRTLRSHAGCIVAVAACPFAARLATLGKDGRLIVRNYLQEFARSCIVERECKLEGSSLLWLPTEVDPSGTCVVAGFHNGVIAMYCCTATTVFELQALRPHDAAVITLAVAKYSGGSLLASGGQDGTVCVIDVLQKSRRLLLRPRGLLTVLGPVTSLCWRPGQESILMVCCKEGNIAEYVLTPDVSKGPKPLDLSVEPRNVMSLQSLLDRKNDIVVTLGRYNTTSNLAIFVVSDNENWAAICEIDIAMSTVISCQQLPISHGAILTCADLTSECHAAILGFNTGEIQISLRDGDELPWQRFWRLILHESEHGSDVTSVTFGFDLEHCFSCGVDGNEFVFRLCQRYFGEQPPCKPPSITVDLTQRRIGLPARNLTLTMRQVRELKEERRMKRAIKNKKINITKKLEDLKARYKCLLERQTEVDLPTSSEELHPRLLSHQERELAALRSNLLGETEDRLRSSDETWSRVYEHFIAPLHSDSLRACAFRDTNCYVESYRLRRLDEEMLKNCEELRKQYEEEKATRESCQHVTDVTPASDTSSYAESEIEETVTPEPTQDIVEVETTSLTLERLKRHREQRALRLQQLDELEAARPSRVGVQLSKEDKVKVREAERTIGDYRLKCDPELRAPPDLTVSPLRTQHELAQTKLQIHQLKDEFNRQVFTLKTRKSMLIQRWKELSDKDGFMEMADIMKLTEEETSEKDLLKLCGGKGSEGNTAVLVDENYEGITSFEALNEAITQYDEAIRTQVAARAHSDASVCLLHLRVISLRREGLILEEFIPRERALEQRLQEARDTKAELEKQLSAVTEQSKQQRRRVAELRREYRAVERRLFAEAGSSTFYSSLVSMIRSRPPSFSLGTGSVAGSSVESEGSGDTPPSRRRRRSGGNISSCPPGCDPAHFALAGELRLQRIEINKMVTEENKVIEFLMKEHEILVKRINLVDNTIKSINEEIQNFQRERQERLDALEEALPVRLHQLPADARLAECVVMPRAVMTRLKARAQELRNDTTLLEQTLAEDKKSLQTLTMGTQQTERKISSLKIEIEEAMRKRFGKVVNMEEMEEAVLTADLESAHLIQLDPAKKEQITKLEREVLSLRENVKTATKEKSDLTKRLAMLLKEKNDLVVVKPKRHEGCGRTERAVLERSVLKLQEVYRSQAEQIAGLRHELGMLRCKMTSSRDLFPAAATYSPRVVSAGESSENSVEQTPPVSRRVRADSTSITSVAPEIVIQHCPDPEPELDT